MRVDQDGTSERAARVPDSLTATVDRLGFPRTSASFTACSAVASVHASRFAPEASIRPTQGRFIQLLFVLEERPLNLLHLNENTDTNPELRGMGVA